MKRSLFAGAVLAFLCCLGFAAAAPSSSEAPSATMVSPQVQAASVAQPAPSAVMAVASDPYADEGPRRKQAAQPVRKCVHDGEKCVAPIKPAPKDRCKINSKLPGCVIT